MTPSAHAGRPDVLPYITAAIVGLLLCIINPIVGFLVAWWMIETHEDHARRKRIARLRTEARP